MNPLTGSGANFPASGGAELLNKLQEIAKVLGHNVIAPPMLRGKSGISHSFSLLAASKEKLCAVDVYDEISEVDVLKTYVKKLDTCASCYIVTSRSPGERVLNLSSQYQIGCFRAEEMGELAGAKKAVLNVRVI